MPKNFFDNSQEFRDPSSSTDEFDTVKLNILCFKLFSHIQEYFLQFLENWFANIVEFISGHCVTEIILLHQILHIHIEICVSWKDLSLSFYILHQLHNSLFIFKYVTSSRSFHEILSVELEDSLVKISAS